MVETEATRFHWSRPISATGSLLPLGLVVCGHPLLRTAIWGGVGTMAFLSGRRAELCLQSRPAATACGRCDPSCFHRLRGEATLRITGWPRRNGDRWTAPATLLVWNPVESAEITIEEAGRGIYLRGSGRAPELWQRIGGRIEVRRPRRASIAGGFNMSEYLAGRGLHWIGEMDHEWIDIGELGGSRDPLEEVGRRFLSPLRRVLLAEIHRSLPPREAMLLASVLLGERRRETAAVKDVFTDLGLAHIFAVSGLHVGIVIALLAAVLLPLRAGPTLRLSIAGLVLPVYVLLTGMSGSVVRAAQMAFLALSGPVVGRRTEALHSLATLLWLNLLWTPWSILDVGTRLSYLAVAGILVVNRLLGHRLRQVGPALRFLLQGLAVTVGAQWFTLIEIANAFGKICLAAPVINLLAVPMFSVAVWLGIAGIALRPVWNWAGEALLADCWLIWRFLQAGSSLLSRSVAWQVNWMPWPWWRVVAFCAATCWVITALRRSSDVTLGFRASAPAGFAIGVLLAVVFLPVSQVGSGSMRATIFAVGQGDCSLLEFPDGYRVLIDTGGGRRAYTAAAWNVIPWLRRRGIDRLDATVLTHGHADHTGGAAVLAEELEIRRWYPGGRAVELDVEWSTGASAGDLRTGDRVYECGPWSLRCLYPSANQSDNDFSENNTSIVLGLYRDGKARGLWSGDLEAEGEEVLLSQTERDGGGFQVWKAGHHGSSTSGTLPFLEWVAPRLVVVCCGVENKHGHPSHGPYVARGDTALVLRTDLDGTVTLIWDDAGGLHWHDHRGRRGEFR